MSEAKYCMLCGREMLACECVPHLFAIVGKSSWDAVMINSNPDLIGLLPDVAETPALASVDLVSPGEVAAMRERDAALVERDRWLEHTKFVMRSRIHLRAQLAAKDARIAELDSMLATRQVRAPDTQKPTPDVFRDFSGDRCRFGG